MVSSLTNILSITFCCRIFTLLSYFVPLRPKSLSIFPFLDSFCGFPQWTDRPTDRPTKHKWAGCRAQFFSTSSNINTISSLRSPLAMTIISVISVSLRSLWSVSLCLIGCQHRSCRQTTVHGPSPSLAALPYLSAAFSTCFRPFGI